MDVIKQIGDAVLMLIGVLITLFVIIIVCSCKNSDRQRLKSLRRNYMYYKEAGGPLTWEEYKDKHPEESPGED